MEQFAHDVGIDCVSLLGSQLAPTDLRGVFAVQGRGGTVLQPAINFLLGRPDFPPAAPIMLITDGWCEEELTVPRDYCFLLPRKKEQEKVFRTPLRTTAPVFRVLKEERYERVKSKPTRKRLWSILFFYLREVCNILRQLPRITAPHSDPF